MDNSKHTGGDDSPEPKPRGKRAPATESTETAGAGETEFPSGNGDGGDLPPTDPAEGPEQDAPRPEQPPHEPEPVEGEAQDVPDPALVPTPVRSVPEARAVTRARVDDLRSLISTYVRRHLPVTTESKTKHPEPPRATGTHARLLPVLAVIPWLLGLLFVFSFFWDFNGITISLLGRTLVVEGLLRVLSVGGLIGFFTNWLAITMLFNPRERRPIFGQGLIPAQRDRVVFRLARAVSEELINEEIIKQKIEEAQVIPRYRELAMSVTRGVLEDPAFRSDLKVLVSDYVETVLTSDQVRQRIVDFTVEKIEDYLGESLGGIALKAYRFLNEDDFKRRIDRAVHAIPGSLDTALDQIDDLLDTIPEKIEARSEDIEQFATRVVLGFVENLDVYGMVMSNLSRYDDRRLETLLKNTSNEQLNYIKYLGGVLGFVGGFVIWEPVVALVTLGAIGGVLFGVDELLFRVRANKALPPAKP